jgi:hypothetical protein
MAASYHPEEIFETMKLVYSHNFVFRYLYQNKKMSNLVEILDYFI